jgi:hypothetical protein
LIESVRPIDLQVICAWFQDSTDEDIRRSIKQQRHEDGGAEAVADEVFEDIPPDGFHIGGGDVGDEVFEDPEVPQADLTGSLATSGLHHVIDNATKGFEDVLPSYRDNVYRCQEICKLVRHRDTQVKLLERCFSSPLGKQLHHHIKSFKGHIFPGRWGTVAFSIPEILKVKGALRWGWDKDRYMRGVNKFGNCGCCLDVHESTPHGSETTSILRSCLATFRLLTDYACDRTAMRLLTLTRQTSKQQLPSKPLRTWWRLWMRPCLAKHFGLGSS